MSKSIIDRDALKREHLTKVVDELLTTKEIKQSKLRHKILSKEELNIEIEKDKQLYKKIKIYFQRVENRRKLIDLFDHYQNWRAEEK
jgi:5'(3')-deoxyribonucleotidase